MSLKYPPLSNVALPYVALIVSPLLLSFLLLFQIPSAGARVITPTSGISTPITLIYSGKPVAFIVPPFTGPDGQVYAPADFFKLVGASYIPNASSQTVVIVSAKGERVVTKYLAVSGRCCVPVVSTAEALGGAAEWDPKTRSLNVLSKLIAVHKTDGALQIETSYPTTYQVGQLDDPPRVYIDLANTDVGEHSAAIDNDDAEAFSIRVGQATPTVTRVVLDLKGDVNYQVKTPPLTDIMKLALQDRPVMNDPMPPTLAAQGTETSDVAESRTPRSATEGGQPIVPPTAVSSATSGPPVGDPQAPGTPPFKITSITFDNGDASHFLITVTTNGSADFSTVTLDQPARLAFDLPGAVFDSAVSRTVPVNDPMIKDIRSGILEVGRNSLARIVVDLSQALGYVVTSRNDTGGTTYLIDLDRTGVIQPVAPPTFSPYDLHGRTVVVDPGHGADDSGAVGINGIREKDITLSIGKKLRDVLVAAGATVHMTRETDVKPSVGERPLMAIAWHADYFISVHCDESGPDNSHSGTTVYFHAQNQLCRRMAQDISGRVGEVSGIPALGVKSDTIRFQSGFGVLRGSPMPAVLVECGYVNDVFDAGKLVDQGVQQEIAAGIAAGLRDFIAEQKQSH